MAPPPTALVAIGGNSLIADKRSPDVPHQWDAVRETCKHLADMVEAGWRLVITHGNGPQVGYILRRNEIASAVVHTTPLDIIVADTQGSIGYMLQQALSNELRLLHRIEVLCTGSEVPFCPWIRATVPYFVMEMEVALNPGLASPPIVVGEVAESDELASPYPSAFLN